MTGSLSKVAGVAALVGSAVGLANVDCTGVDYYGPGETYRLPNTKVVYGVNGNMYTNSYYADAGQTPTTQYGPWIVKGSCTQGTAGTGPTLNSVCATAWSSVKTYSTAGTTASSNGNNYQNLWYTQGGPDPSVNGEWGVVGPCGGGSTPTVAPVTPTYAPPTVAPVVPTYAPPTVAPVVPTYAPPTAAPTQSPARPTYAPTAAPTVAPTVPVGPTAAPSPSGSQRDLYVYIDTLAQWNIQGACSAITSMAKNGVNNVLASFWVDPNTGPMDFVGYWMGSDACKTKAVSALQANGGRGVIMSCGGATAQNFWTFDATQYAAAACDAATSGGFQGIDFDLENMSPGDTTIYVNWMVTASKAAQACIGWVSHAPQSPYFGVNNGFGDIYGQVIDQAGSSINKLLIQYYNQGNNADDYDSLFNSFNGASIGEIAKAHPNAANGMLVVGKYNTQSDASNGYMSSSSLDSALCQGEQSNAYTGGVMLWQDHVDNDRTGMYKALKTKC